jgi:hypothetical protein
VRIRCGFNLAYELQEPLAMLLAPSLHPSRQADLLTASSLVFRPHVNAESYIDDVALTITIGQSTLSQFEVFTEELPAGE